MCHINYMQTKADMEEMNLVMLAQEYADEDKARELLESLLWPNGPVCPHCKNHKEKAIYRLKSKEGSKSKVRKGLCKCGACRKTFTVTVGTIFEDSHIPISKWLMAIFILCSSKKSISANQMSRMLKTTVRTAWFMNHRIRFAMSPEMPLYRLLKGVVEVDETFVGGKGDRHTRFSRRTPVMALIEQDGQMRTRVVPSVSQHNIGNVLRDCVAKDAVICTDEWTAYKKAAQDYKAHHTVIYDCLLFQSNILRHASRRLLSTVRYLPLLRQLQQFQRQWQLTVQMLIMKKIWIMLMVSKRYLKKEWMMVE